MRRALIVTFLLIVALVVAALLGAPRVGRWYLRARVLPRVAARLGSEITVGRVKVGFGGVELSDLVLRSKHDGEQPLFAAERVAADFRIRPLFARRLEIGEVVVWRPKVSLLRRPDGEDNIKHLLARLRRGSKGGGSTSAGQKPRLRIGRVRLLEGTLLADDQKLRLRAQVGQLRGTLAPERPSRLLFEQVKIDSALVPSTISLERVEVAGRLSRRKPTIPKVRIEGGRVRLLPRLRLTGIEGMVYPTGPRRVRITLEGSYGGAKARLWHASGVVNPFERQGELEIRAARFKLERIESILRETPVILPRATTIDGQLKLRYAEKALSFDGGMEVSKLNLFHPGLARTPVLDLSGTVKLTGRYADRVLDIARFEVDSRGVQAKLSLQIDRSQPEPVISGRLVVPPVKCQELLEAFPPALVPNLQGFKLRGNFAVDLRTHVDFAELDELELGGKVGIDRCKVLAAPPAVSAERLRGSFEHTVEAYPGRELTFTIGPENRDFTPYDMISPNIIGAFLTTEDAAFFRHRGFIPMQFRKALGRNLKRGSFRLGASTITMQTVKNVLLSHEKTLSRKLQELFLVWYVERELTKERLMELYLNAIEFGPGIYGIGRATRHYFGKHPIEITPLEAAFFATILPSPRRRYVQYCQGELSGKWDRYVRRVLRRMHTRGHVTDEALAASAEQEIMFYRDLKSLSVRECKGRIQALNGAWRAEYLRRLKDSVLRAAPHQLRLYVQ